MYAAVAQFTVVQVSLLGALACQFRNARHSLSLLLAFRNLLQHLLCDVGILMQEVIHFGLYEVAHVLVHAHTIGTHGERTEFYLCLTLEHRFLHIHRDGRHETVTYVGIFEVLARELLYGACYMLLECTLMRAALRGVLSVHEGVVLLSVLVGVCECYLDVLPLEVYDGVESVVGHIVCEQVFQSVAAENPAPIIHYDETGVQVGIVSEHRLHEVVVETVVLEEFGVWFEEDVCSVLVLCLLRGVVHQFALLENHRAHFAVAVTACLEVSA